MTPVRRLRAACLALLFALGLPAAAVVPPDWAPRAGDWIWEPELAPAGPVVVLVSLPMQQLHVYRNGVRIGASTISSGKRGHETPTGVFTILQKRAEHYSNLYDGAPMPWMQRLTWDGIALHAGRLPGHPASHGCIRLPDAFAKTLFATTRTGDVVIVSDRATPPGIVAGDLPAPRGAATAPAAADFWTPELAPSGPVSVVLSTADGRLEVTRDGRRIGRASVRVAPGLRVGTRAYVMLDGAGEGANPMLPERPARRWMAVGIDGDADGAVADGVLREAMRAGALAVPADVARRIDDLLRPGTTVIVTDAPLGDGGHAEPLRLEGDGSAT